jgi:hypothetical protein
MSGLYNKNFLNSPSQDGGAFSDVQWRLIIVILLVFVIVIIDVATKSETGSTAQIAMLSLWIIMLVIPFLGSIYTLGGKNTNAKRNTQIILLVFLVLDLIWACVLLAISSPDLSGKEQGVLFGRMIVLYSIPIILFSVRLYDIVKNPSGSTKKTS